jgi:hypothetical protein
MSGARSGALDDRDRCPVAAGRPCGAGDRAPQPGLRARFAPVLNAAAAHVIATARRADLPDRPAKKCRSRIETLAGYITEPGHPQDLKLASRHSRIDVPVNNTGTYDDGPTEQQSLDDLRQVTQVKPPHRCTILNNHSKSTLYGHDGVRGDAVGPVRVRAHVPQSRPRSRRRAIANRVRTVCAHSAGVQNGPFGRGTSSHIADPIAEQNGGDARVSDEQAKSQKVTLSWAPLRPDRIVHVDAEGQRGGRFAQRTVTGGLALVVGTSRRRVAHQGRVPGPAASAGSPRGWLMPSPRSLDAEGWPPSVGRRRRALGRGRGCRRCCCRRAGIPGCRRPGNWC